MVLIITACKLVIELHEQQEVSLPFSVQQLYYYLLKGLFLTLFQVPSFHKLSEPELVEKHQTLFRLTHTLNIFHILPQVNQDQVFYEL